MGDTIESLKVEELPDTPPLSRATYDFSSLILGIEEVAVGKKDQWLSPPGNSPLDCAMGCMKQGNDRSHVGAEKVGVGIRNCGGEDGAGRDSATDIAERVFRNATNAR